MNANDLAKKVAKKEGGKKALSIAQIKEVLRCEWDVHAEEAARSLPAWITFVFNGLLLSAQKRLEREKKRRYAPYPPNCS